VDVLCLSFLVFSCCLFVCTHVAESTPGSTPSTSYTFHVSSDVTFHPSGATVSLLKRKEGPLDAGCSIASQVQVISLGTLPDRTLEDVADEGQTTDEDATRRGGVEDTLSSPAALAKKSAAVMFEQLYSCLHLSFTPLVRSYAGQRLAQQGDHAGHNVVSQDEASALTDVRKHLSQLELSLANFRQDVQIPEVRLDVPAEVTAAVARAEELGLSVDAEMDVAALGLDSDKITSTELVPCVTSSLNNFIEDAAMVSRLDRDAASGTTNDEVKFWTRLLAALNHLNTQISGPAVGIMLSVLRETDPHRFYIMKERLKADTGIEVALSKVKNVVNLVANCPLEPLFAATDVEGVRQGIAPVFKHLTRLTVAEYASKWGGLLAALSRDITRKLIEVLPTNLMVLPYVAQCDRVMRSSELACGMAPVAH